MEEENFTCNECDAEFTIMYEAAQGSPTACPFCSAPLEDDLPDLEEEWDENPNPYGDAED